ncbi:hypothetical protein GJU39_20840 [Pedobacter petrophilus]|uniref:Uncharacterized protein n=1 Tax=Pedobacter petrophilus TaxID=1908241 RepID=A0A7K0G5N2_9SPHI|nr:hypothetical protein [Pedobacter petrophilus]
MEQVTLKASTSPACPKCKNPETYRVPRSFLFKKILTMVPVKRYKCYRCFNQFNLMS